jgi:hypothetical protein
MTSRPITMERLAELLDAYGAAPERWPEAERHAARQLVDGSLAARALYREAEALDRELDVLPPEPPSALLVARVLAAAPRPARPWRRVLAVAVPLAAAAAVTLWLRTAESPAPRLAATSSTAELGEYTSPTDVLLNAYAIDVSGTMPAIGCADSTLGCPQVEDVEPYSRRGSVRRFRA